jgi:hypothetical protein
MKTFKMTLVVFVISLTSIAMAQVKNLSYFDQELSKVLDKPGKKESLELVNKAQDFLAKEGTVLSLKTDRKTMKLVLSVSEKICRIDPSAYIAELLTIEKIRTNSVFKQMAKVQPNSCLSAAFLDYDAEQVGGNDRSK